MMNFFYLKEWSEIWGVSYIDALSHSLDKRAEQSQQDIAALSRSLDKKIGELGNRIGDFVEGLIAPSVVDLFRARGIDVNILMRDIEVENRELGLAMQIDLFVVNGDSCGLIEVKSRLSQDDVDEHLERMKKFKPLFPDYQHKQVFGAVAAIVIPKNIGRYAYQKGLFVITQTGDNAVILNDKKFTPKFW